MPRGFCYFIEGPVSTPAHIYPLAIPCLKEPSLQVRGSANGPGEKGGALVWRDAPGCPLWKYQAERQTWARVDKDVLGNKVRYWVGFDRDERPCPETLLRPEKMRFAGNKIELAKMEWLVPKIRMLPKALTWAPDGMRFEPKAEYQDLVDRAQKYFDVRVGMAEKNTVDDQVLLRLAVDVLGLNYSMDMPELGILALLDTKSCVEVLDIAVDLDALDEFIGEAKKNEPSGSESSGAETSTSGAAAG